MRERITRVLEAAIRAADPVEAVRDHLTLEGETLRIGVVEYRLPEIDRIFVVGGGKAGAPMAAAVRGVVGDRITAGLVNVKRGHTGGPAWRVAFGTGGGPAPEPRCLDIAPVEIVEAAHPVPDESGLQGAERMARLLRGLTPRDLVIVLLSGGGSALLVSPAGGISLQDLQATTDLLLRCGADIGEVNAVRKHCSWLAGGQLARLAAPARVAGLILSDVVGSPLDVIASGPTVPDPTTFDDALAVLSRHGLTERVPAPVLRHLEAGADGKVPDTPKPGDPLLDQVHNTIVGDNVQAARAACREASRQGWKALHLTSRLEGEAREAGRMAAGLAAGIAAGQCDVAPPACLVLGGETTVTVRGTGKGGRNQELALAAAVALDRSPSAAEKEIAVVSLATDGNDGPTDAAGGIAFPDTVARGRTMGLNAGEALDENDSYSYLGALEDLIVTGPTNTNVNDLVFVFVE